MAHKDSGLTAEQLDFAQGGHDTDLDPEISMLDLSDSAKAAAVMWHVYGDVTPELACKVYDELRLCKDDEGLEKVLSAHSLNVHGVEELPPNEWFEKVECLAFSIDDCRFELET